MFVRLPFIYLAHLLQKQEQPSHSEQRNGAGSIGLESEHRQAAPQVQCCTLAEASGEGRRLEQDLCDRVRWVLAVGNLCSGTL